MHRQLDPVFGAHNEKRGKEEVISLIVTFPRAFLCNCSDLSSIEIDILTSDDIQLQKKNVGNISNHDSLPPNSLRNTSLPSFAIRTVTNNQSNTKVSIMLDQNLLYL